MNIDTYSYEKQLSTFGKKVLSVLLKKWNRDSIRDGSTPNLRNMPGRSSWISPRMHNRKVLTYVCYTSSITELWSPGLLEGVRGAEVNTFLSTENPIQTCNSALDNISNYDVPGMEIVDVTSHQGPMTHENNLNVLLGPLPHIPKSNDLVYTLDTSPSNLCYVNKDELIRTIDKNNFFEHVSVNTDVQQESLHDNEMITKEANIDWHNMFDTELISDVGVAIINETDHFNNNNSETASAKAINPQATNNIRQNTKTEKTLIKPFEMHTKEKQDSKKRKAQSKMTDAIPKKVKKPKIENQNVYRKQKYTTTVKNWLDNTDLDHPVDENPSKNTCNTDITNNNSKIEIVIEKDKKLTSTKKTVQTRLANKGGVMKFSKRKNSGYQAAVEDTITIEQNKPTNIVNCTENIKTDPQNTSKVNNKEVVEHKPSSVIKEKQTKRNFIAPIKSQIPVKDVNYNIVEVNADVSKDLNYEVIIKDVTDSDVLAVLIYNNGFCQLNKHHTEDACKVVGILLKIDDMFYYFKGCNQSFNKNLLKQILDKSNIICFDGKSVLIYLKSQFDLDSHHFNIIDVQIGACILEPDSSVDNFSELQKVVSFIPSWTVATECDLQKAGWYITMLKECAHKLVLLLTENDLWRVFVNIEMKLLPIIADMERQGVQIDITKLKTMEDTLLSRMKGVEQQCYQAAGKPFQINSTLQVRTIVYEELKLDTKCNVKIRETIAQGAKSTSEAMLRSLISVHPLPKLILEYRRLHKAQATFLAGVAQHVRDGVVRPTWVQTAAVTGRIASSNPNLQAIPKAPFNMTLFPDGDASNETMLFRSVYTCPAGWTVVAADFKQVECRVWAEVAGDRQLCQALRAPDLFKELAQLWLQKPPHEISGSDRERTKRMVYATLYGAGCRKLMDILELSYDQTLAVVASFNRTFPSLKSFGSDVVSRCRAAGGALRTASGRRRSFPQLEARDAAQRAHAERQAVNFLIQGSAADLCKLAMVATVARLRAARLDFRLVLQIHDELVFHVRSSQLETAAGIIKRAMEGCGAAGSPRPVRLAAGRDWARAAPYAPAPTPAPSDAHRDHSV